jgi:CRP-like cAMP-binding protein
MDAVVSKKLDDFFKQFKHQVYKKGEILVRADEDPSGVFYLTSGTVKEYTISKKGEELVINVFKSVSFFPMSWAINQTPNVYYFEALEELEIWNAPREEVVKFIKDNPDVLYNLMSRVFIGTDGILMRMVYLMSGEAYTRVITELLIAAKRFGKTNPDKSIKLSLTEKDLANQAGMARETVSREITKLKDQGLVVFDRNVLIIKNIDKLEEELSN